MPYYEIVMLRKINNEKIAEIIRLKEELAELGCTNRGLKEDCRLKEAKIRETESKLWQKVVDLEKAVECLIQDKKDAKEALRDAEEELRKERRKSESLELFADTAVSRLAAIQQRGDYKADEVHKYSEEGDLLTVFREDGKVVFGGAPYETPLTLQRGQNGSVKLSQGFECSVHRVNTPRVASMVSNRALYTKGMVPICLGHKFHVHKDHVEEFCKALQELENEEQEELHIRTEGNLSFRRNGQKAVFDGDQYENRLVLEKNGKKIGVRQGLRYSDLPNPRYLTAHMRLQIGSLSDMRKLILDQEFAIHKDHIELFCDTVDELAK